MPKTLFRYAVSYGLSGCYMPDSLTGPYTGSRRSDLSSLIADMLEHYDLPKSEIKQVKMLRLWSYIKRHGSSSAHFSIDHKGNCLSFHGLTEDEATQMETEND